MVTNRMMVFIGLSAVLFFILACGPGSAPSQGSPTLNMPPDVLTFAVQTMTAQVVNIPSATLIDFTQATLTPTIEAPAIPTETPTITVASSPTIPLVSVRTATDCRMDPADVYEILAIADAGVKYTLVGRHSPTGYWIILMPAINSACWLRGGNAQTEGNINNLPEYAIPLGSIQGFVKDVNTGKPVKGATVQLQSMGTSATTDSNGFYSFNNVPVGSVVIIANASSYTFITVTVRVQTGQVVMAQNITGGRSIPITKPPSCSPLTQSCGTLPTLVAKP